MNNLSEKMQERLDAWRNNTLAVPSSKVFRAPEVSRRSGKNDYGDVFSEQEWEEEVRKSQTRK